MSIQAETVANALPRRTWNETARMISSWNETDWNTWRYLEISGDVKHRKHTAAYVLETWWSLLLASSSHQMPPVSWPLISMDCMEWLKASANSAIMVWTSVSLQLEIFHRSLLFTSISVLSLLFIRSLLVMVLMVSHGPHGFFPPSTQLPTGRKPSSNSRDSLKSPVILSIEAGTGTNISWFLGFGWDFAGFWWTWIIFAALPDHQNESLEDFHGLRPQQRNSTNSKTIQNLGVSRHFQHLSAEGTGALRWSLTGPHLRSSVFRLAWLAAGWNGTQLNDN